MGRPEKAYRNLDFISSKAARTIRILSEYVEPETRFAREGIDKVVCFFGSARALSATDARANLERGRAKADPKELERLEIAVKLSRYYEDARELATLLTNWARELGRGGRTEKLREPFVLCSGGGPGIMEAANRGAAEAQGRSIGLNISLPMEQEPNPYITDELNVEFHYFFMRKLWFVQLSCAVVIFPGGYGTLDELAELLTLIQTKRSAPMPVVLYGNEFWDDVLNLDALERWGTITAEDRSLLYRCDTPIEAFDYLKAQLGAELEQQAGP